MASGKTKVLVGGGAGFIGSHLCRRLREHGYYVIAADWKSNEFMEPAEFCDEFVKVDLRSLDNCVKAAAGCEHVYNLACDMGGMGFIHGNNAVIMYNNTMISLNMLEGARQNGAKRFFYTSTACVYPMHRQENPDCVGLREHEAWPAQPQDAYGLEKIYGEKAAEYYALDHGIQTRVARLHNVYGPRGTWYGGREKAPAAFVRKAILAREFFEMWGDGEQTRSFCYIDDCVEGIFRLMHSDFPGPVNIGSEEMLSMNEMAKMVLELAGKTGVPIKHDLSKPQGVRGRNSENTLIKEKLGWAPSISLQDGLARTFPWIQGEVDKLRAAGENVDALAISKVVESKPTAVGELRKD